MQDTLSIRRATQADIESLVEMRLRLQRHMEASNSRLWGISETKISAMPEFYRVGINDPNALLLVVQGHESEDLAGMGLGRICRHGEYVPSASGRIDDIWIEPALRRKGVGTRLVTELLKFFRLRGIEALVLDYAEGNVEAEAMWRRFGFAPVLITATTALTDAEAECQE